MNLFITGITGFIGQHLVDYFHQKPGYNLYGMSRWPEKSEALFGAKVEEIVRKADAQYLIDRKIDIVIHLAGLAHDLSNTYNEEDYFRVNYADTASLYDQFQQSTAKTFIFISSIKAAVDFTDGLVDESTEPVPVTPYGKSKLKAENHLLQQVLPEGKKIYILRPCVVYGPGNKGNLNVLYKFVKKGIPYPFGAFQNKRSFLYIKNFLYALEQMWMKDAPAGIYHVCDSQRLSTEELVKILGESLNKKVRVWNVPKPFINLAAKTGDVLGLFFNSHTLHKLTENMEVSNAKLLKAIGTDLPFDTRIGLLEMLKEWK